MFSGIVEEFAVVTALESEGTNLNITMRCSFTSELKIDQSVAHNGVCLTVVAINGDEYTVTAIKETLERSNLGLLKVGDKVNLERSMMMNGRLDGHIVQGHVDTTCVCYSRRFQKAVTLHILSNFNRFLHLVEHDEMSVGNYVCKYDSYSVTA